MRETENVAVSPVLGQSNIIIIPQDPRMPSNLKVLTPSQRWVLSRRIIGPNAGLEGLQTCVGASMEVR